MSDTISGSTKLILATTLQSAAADGIVTSDVMNETIQQNITNGTGSGKAQIQWHTRLTLNNNASTTLDLQALTGNGGPKGTFTFTKVKEILVKVVTVTTGYVLDVGNAASNQFVGPLKDASDIACPGPNSLWHVSNWVDGWTVDGTHKDLKFLNNASGGALVFDIYIIGEGSVV